MTSRQTSTKQLILLGTHETHIHSVIFDPVARTLERGVSTPTAAHPSWIAKHPLHADLIYTNGWVDGTLFLYRMKDDKGTIELLDQAESGGGGPTHFAVLPGAKELAIAHYKTGSVTVLPLLPSGKFATPSPSPSRIFVPPYEPLKHHRQEAPHVHQIVVTPTGEILTPDLGSNKVWRWKWDAGNEKLELKGEIGGLEDGDGPRHLVLHPSGSHVYVLNEVSSHLSIHTLPPLSEGAGAGFTTSTLVAKHSMLPPSDDGKTPRETGGAEIILLPSITTGDGGRLLLIASNRDSPDPANDTLALFSVSTTDGEDVTRAPDSWVGGIGKHLRAVEQSEDGKYVLVAARDTGTVVIFERAGTDGLGLSEVARLEGVEQVVVPLWV